MALDDGDWDQFIELETASDVRGHILALSELSQAQLAGVEALFEELKAKQMACKAALEEHRRTCELIANLAKLLDYFDQEHGGK